MALLLLRHVVDCAAAWGIVAHHRQLALVDLRRAIFSGLVNPDHRCDIGR